MAVLQRVLTWRPSVRGRGWGRESKGRGYQTSQITVKGTLGKTLQKLIMNDNFSLHFGEIYLGSIVL